ncbi:hypothetical protein ACYG9Z_24925 [Mesorhizobium sp. RSR380A]|uniref:hypothetical protein n=1 Tax=unclassified Mesorhizobium TaxID=325217 RepID=UPI0003CEAB61|nr:MULTISPECIES: hypothetical protein [unclassified Mesorhizobium]ESW68213.1 hypothetical protein X771_12245 [Mesorhizobium sp. LSJC277A00]ESX60008.1 hypothetical protein X760_17625 [Mesorhizobium sp. LSHC422A00]ESY47570.1 hypothetical protein X746_12575 [Mesorhizobium sp. LNJC380A00]
MDISSARLTALLREAMMLAALPSAKADPAKAALMKALVQPPAPSGAPLKPAAAPALQALLSAATAKGQQTGSAEILQAYLALAEPGVEAPDEVAPTRVVAGSPANDDTQRGLLVPPAKAEDGAAAKPAGLPWFALLAPVVSPQRRAATADMPMKREQATSGPNDAAQPEGRQQTRVGLMALATGFLAVAIVGLALLVLR